MAEDLRTPSSPAGIVRRLRRVRPTEAAPAPLVTWGQLAAERPEVAETAAALLYQFGVGLAFLSTVRPDGGPRVHPMCPAVIDGGLYAFLVPSPKRDDLRRDPRYALHCYPPAESEDAVYLTGHAAAVDDPERTAVVRAGYFAEREWEEPPAGFEVQHLFEFRIATCLLTTTTGHGDEAPVHSVWKAGRPGPAGPGAGAGEPRP